MSLFGWLGCQEYDTIIWQWLEFCFFLCITKIRCFCNFLHQQDIDGIQLAPLTQGRYKCLQLLLWGKTDFQHYFEIKDLQFLQY